MTKGTAEDAAVALATLLGVPQHDVAIVIGSGWADAVPALGREVGAVDATAIPGFRPSSVDGHTGVLRSVAGPTGRRILVLGARHHLYEARDPQAVAHAVRTAAAAGCATIVFTNAAGSLRTDWPPGTVTLISDHINLTGATPLVGPRFVDMTDAYSPRLRSLARTVEPTLDEGVYAQFPGPQYETPAEVRMAGTLGANLVGMSTALEVIAARAEGMEVLALSLVTNLAAGVAGAPLSHAEVLAAGANAGPHVGALLADIAARL